MIVTWMLAATLFALLLTAAARAVDAAVRLFSWQGRAAWAAALGASVIWPLMLPLLARQSVVRLAPVVVGKGAVETIAAELPSVPAGVSSRVDVVLLALWAAASLLLAVRLVFAHCALTRISRSARATSIDGRDVLITDGVGPAVLGIVAPRVAVPAWLAELDEPLRDLVLRHEREHCRAHDTMLLWLGEVAVALMPWNPAVWWQARQLRLAVELDCDSRTLDDSAAATTYGRLLLFIAQRQQQTRLAPMLAESNSHLARRIHAMTRRSISHKPLRAALLGSAAVVAIVAACSSRVGGDLVGPRPTGGKPIAAALLPTDSSGRRAPRQVQGAQYFEYQVEKPVTYAPGSPAPKYPDILKTAGVEGSVLVTFVVDTMGLADPQSVKIIKSTHQLFTDAVLTAIPNMRFTPAMVGNRKVKQVVTNPFVFTIVDHKSDRTR